MSVRLKMNSAGASNVLHAPGVEALVLQLARPVAAAAQQDPNEEYAASIRVAVKRTAGKKGRVSARVSALPGLGAAVESKRGTLARALGDAG